MTAARYRRGLRTTVAASAAPYGYTLTIWTSGAVLAHERGIPDALGSVLFGGGALLGFGVVGLVAYGGIGGQPVPAPAPFSVWHSLHVVGVGVAIGLALAAGELLDHDAAWLLGGFAATVVYLLAGGLPHALARRPRPDEGQGRRA
jgi:hypothetical protein